MNIKCQYCNEDFEQKVKKQLYCSTKCRVYDNRNKKKSIVTDNMSIVTPIVTKMVRKSFNSGLCTKHTGSMKGTCGCK